MNGSIQIEIDGIISEIVDKYYSDNKSYSEVTSSHWKKYDNNIFEIKNNIIELKSAGGFGDFASSTFKNTLIHLPESFLTYYILKKYVVDNNLIKISKKICHKQQKLQLFDSVKHLIILTNLIQNYQLDKFKSFCIIGDGFGYLTSMLREIYPTKKIFNINLGRQLLYDYILLKKTCPHGKFALHDGSVNFDINSANTIFIPAEYYHLIESLEIDFFFNVASMQEMDISVINNYFSYIRNSKAKEKLFYNCNRDSKTLPDGSVIKFDEYGWGNGEIIFDQNPEWYQFYPNPKPPFWRPFDGTMRERLFKF